MHNFIILYEDLCNYDSHFQVTVPSAVFCIIKVA